MGQEKINHSKEGLKDSISSDNIESSAGNESPVKLQKPIPDASQENVENLSRKGHRLKRTNSIYGSLSVDTRGSPQSHHSITTHKQDFFKTPLSRPTKRRKKTESAEEASTAATIKPLVEAGQNIPKP